MNVDTLLIEIGVEELPAIPFLKELPNIASLWQKILKENSLESEFKFYYTPRRLVFWHDKFLIKQPDENIQMYGAPLAIAYKDGVATPAALGFAKKCGVDISEINTAQKGGKDVLFFEKVKEGRESSEVLNEMINQFISSLNFGKSMRWGSGSESFIRPIRWFGCMLGDKNIKIEAYEIKSNKSTQVHRNISYEPRSYSDAKEYFSILKNGGVVLDQNDRKDHILKQFKEIEKKEGVEIELDFDLLDEVIAITEYPNALLGKFDESFLELPVEVIITSMKEHQRYFPVFKDNKLQNSFVFVSNSMSEDFSKIIKGNEKVLRPRLSDGMFFYENDLKNGLSSEGLKNITFMQGLGSVYDKVQREAKIADALYDKYTPDVDKALLKKTIDLCKADLLSDMVYEFTELQGLMGYYYALKSGEDKNLAVAIKEQYLPDGEDSDLPSSDFSAIVAMSNKLDSLLAFFSIGKIPTGAKDPFALRRATIGIIKIVLDREFAFDIDKDISLFSKDYKGVDVAKLEQFFIDRINQYFNVNASIINAVLETGERDIVEISKKIVALNEIVSQDDFKEIFSTFKRVANIVKDIEVDENGIIIDEKLFEKEQESNLYNEFKKVNSQNFDNYSDKLKALFSLKSGIDDFFDHVMVNAEDKKIQANRKNLIYLIYNAFREVAEIKEVTL